MRATKAELVEAKQCAVLDGEHDEAGLDLALAALIAPRERLRAEVAYLPRSTPAQARATLARLRAPPFSGSWGEGWDGIAVLAHLLSSGGDTDLVHALMMNSRTPDITGIERDINAARQLSGFPSVARAAIAQEVAALVVAHADTAAERLATAERGIEEATAVVELGLQDAELTPFLGAFVLSFSRYTAPRLAQLAADIDTASVRLREARSLANAESLAACLRRWDAVRQPVQLWDEAQGIDEPVSLALGGKLRDLCIELANEHSAYDAALVVSRALSEAFGELPGMRDLFARDIGTLDELAQQARAIAISAPVTAALAAMAAQPVITARNLDDWIGSPTGKDPGKLRNAFETAIGQLRDDETAPPAIAVRSFTLDLHNDHELTDAALRLTVWLLSYSERLPGPVIAKLREDEATLQRVVRQNELKKALDRGDLDAAETLATELLATASNDDDLKLTGRIFETIVQRRASRNSKRWGWGIAAAFIAFLIIAENSGKKASYSDVSNYTATVPESTSPAVEVVVPSAPGSSVGDPGAETTAPAASDANPGETPASPAPSDGENMEEAKPVALVGQALSRRELRYCLSQKERIAAAGEAVDKSIASEVDGFNATVDDYNGRCGSFRYKEGDMLVVMRVVGNDAAVLANEGKVMVQGWK